MSEVDRAHGEVLAELAALQRAFGGLLRTPLERSGGTLRAASERYASELVAAVIDEPRNSARERLAIYHRQYWFRLFSTLQAEYRLASALLGAWLFNAWAAEFLLEHPPRSADLADVVLGFDAFVAARVPSSIERGSSRAPLPARALVEALTIDRAHGEASRAPRRQPLQLGPAEVATLREAKLVLAPGTTILDEHWPLVALQRELAPQACELPLVLPEPHPRVQSWLIVGGERGRRVLPLVPAHALLLRSLACMRLPAALAELEQAVAPEQRAELPALVQRWLSESVELGLWVGMEACA